MNTFINLLDLSKYKTRTYEKNQYIAYEGDECKIIRIVLSGHIRIISFSSSGQEIVYKELYQGDLFGNNLLFSEKPYYRGNVICVEKSVVIEFNKLDFINTLSSNKRFLEAYLAYQSEDSKRLNQSIKILTCSTSEEKLMYLLQTSNRQIKITSITDLAKRLNTSREATSRLVHKLVKENKISYKDKIIKKI